jgi:hypothetical protein
MVGNHEMSFLIVPDTLDGFALHRGILHIVMTFVILHFKICEFTWLKFIKIRASLSFHNIPAPRMS